MTELIPAPPRAPTQPQIPNPQTNLGILADYGALSDREEISDIQPDFSWMASYEVFMASFRFAVKDSPETILASIYPIAKDVNHDNKHLPVPTHLLPTDWHFIPFFASRWWTGLVRLRFMAIKPRQVTGKLLLTWYPDVSEYDQEGATNDKLRRKIKYEWDLGESNEYSMLISGYNITRLRQTWIPRISGDYENKFSSSVLPPLAQYTMGVVSVTVANQLQPGSLYPDSIRILIFHSFDNTTFHTSVDVRGDQTHIFGVNGPPDWVYST